MLKRFATARRSAPRPQPALTPEQHRFFFENGYLVLPRFVTDEEVGFVLDAVERAWADRSIYNNLTISAYTGTSRYIETYLRNVDPSARSERYKLNHLYLYDARVLALLLSDKIQSVLSALLDGAPLLFNGLNMDIGSEQRLHFDTFYMAPRTPDKMVVTWIPLEDIHPDSGPLVYYPKSHRIPPYRFSHGQIWAVDAEMPAFDAYIEPELASRGLKQEAFCPRKGDLFIWHAQLYHGGSPIRDPRRTRRSMVNHFWRSQDYPADWQDEAAPGRWVLRRDRMFVASNFAPLV
jgi:ectoine hydroxylase-related dioxygenase (phytanoyl-CoA dioxygenase family)